MAIDAWLLEQHSQGNLLPTLRFYTWSPPALSLGYHQKRWPPEWQNLLWQGQPLELVRRPSGGRAVLHQGDLTYAVIVSGLAGTRLESYAYICGFLRQGWQALGYPLFYGDASPIAANNPNCFSLATGADLVLADGYKLIGSAQLRKKQAILQHGSIRLQPDPTLFTQVFDPDPSLSQALGQLPGIETVIASLTAAAQVWFGVDLVAEPLSGRELQMAREGVDRFRVVTKSSSGLHLLR